jgi:hypothetical protein
VWLPIFARIRTFLRVSSCGDGAGIMHIRSPAIEAAIREFACGGVEAALRSFYVRLANYFEFVSSSE